MLTEICFASDLPVSAAQLNAAMLQINPDARFSVIFECANDLRNANLDVATISSLVSSLINPLGATNIFEPNPYLVVPTVPGSCGGLSIVGFKFLYDATCTYLSASQFTGANCCESSSSSSSSEFVPGPTSVLSVGAPTRLPKVVVSVNDFASTSVDSSSSSSSSFDSQIEDILIFLGLEENAEPYNLEGIRVVPTVSVQLTPSQSQNILDEFGAPVLLTASEATLFQADYIQDNVPFIMFDPALSEIDSQNMSSPLISSLRNRISCFEQAMDLSWPNKKFILDHNIGTTNIVSSGSSSLYWSQIQGSTRQSIYNSIRNNLVNINAGSSHLTARVKFDIDASRGDVFGMSSSAAQRFAIREYYTVVRDLMEDVGQVVAVDQRYVYIDPTMIVGDQIRRANALQFYIDIALSGVDPTASTHMGGTPGQKFPWMVSPDEIGYVAQVFRQMSSKPTFVLEIAPEIFISRAIGSTSLVTLPLDLEPGHPDYDRLQNQVEAWMRQYVSRMFVKYILSREISNGVDPPAGFSTWRSEPLFAAIYAAVDELKVEYLNATRRA